MVLSLTPLSRRGNAKDTTLGFSPELTYTSIIAGVTDIEVLQCQSRTTTGILRDPCELNFATSA